jgi:hypothetical protein
MMAQKESASHLGFMTESEAENTQGQSAFVGRRVFPGVRAMA